MRPRYRSVMVEWRRARATWVAKVVGVLATVGAAPAHGEPWIEGRAGAGLVSGPWQFEKAYVDASSVPQIALDEGAPLGVPILLEGMGGYAVSPTVAFGVVAHVEYAPYAESVHARYASLNGQMLASAGPLLVLRPGKALDLRLGLEWVAGRFVGSTQDIGAVDNVFEFEDVSGPGALFSLGCCAERGFGIASELRVARLTSEHTTFLPITFALMATIATR
jgi:hypothetical protein